MKTNYTTDGRRRRKRLQNWRPGIRPTTSTSKNRASIKLSSPISSAAAEEEDDAQDDILLSSPGVDTYLHKQGFENTLHMMIDRESAPLPALPVKVYNQIRADYLENIERTMSGTARGDQETLAEVHILDLTVQAEILTEYSSHDLLKAYKLTHIERTDISIASDDSSDFELYGANESDDDDKESSADKKEEIEYTEYDIFGSPWDSDGERWYHDRTPPISPKEVISLVSGCKL